MRCALAQKDGDVSKFPQPPYTRRKEYSVYPKSFSLYSFGDVVEEFNKKFPELAIPAELVELRDAMAHGIISEIDRGGVDRLVKFKKQNGVLTVGFSMSLESNRLQQIRQSLKELRRYVMKEAGDKQ
jgi:hypothetical protein